MGEYTENWFGDLKERDHLEGKGVDGRVYRELVWRPEGKRPLGR